MIAYAIAAGKNNKHNNMKSNTLNFILIVSYLEFISVLLSIERFNWFNKIVRLVASFSG